MSTSLLAGLLQLWPSLPLRGGEAWLAIKGQAAALLAEYLQAADARARARVELKLIRLFESAGLKRLLASAYTPADHDRGGPSPLAEPNVPAASLESAIERQLEAAAGREINAWVEGLGASEALAIGERYALLFGDDPAGAEVRAGAELPAELLAGRGEPVEALVVLTSADLTIHGSPTQTMLIARAGGESRPARFTVETRHAGPATAHALLIVDNRVFQELRLTFVAGPAHAPAAHTAQVRGLTVDAALQRDASPHRLSLTIVRREAAYELLLVSGSVTRAMLRISEAQLAELVEGARRELRDISELSDGGVQIYQVRGAIIPPYLHRRAVSRLAELGAELYQRLFFGPGSGADAHQLGRLLRELSARQPLRIQVVGERFTFPWTLLFDQTPPELGTDDLESTLRGFWGFRHTVEYLPEFSSPTLVSLLPEIRLDGALGISYIYNQTIDEQVAGRWVATQAAFLRGLPGVHVSEYATRQDLYALLNQADAGGQLLYFYCHAVGVVPGEEGGVSASRLTLTDGDAPLKDLYRRAPAEGPRLRAAPLVFLNACESARLSPYLYDGLVPYFITKGARGVIGSEVGVPAAFAAEFAQELIARFVAEDVTLGEALQRTRQRFLRERNNVLGLIYALYCDADVRVRRSSSTGIV